MLVIITGLPGTGKSTLAAALAAELEAHHLNTDKIREELNLKGQYDPRTKKRIYEVMLQRTEELIKERQVIILDATFYQQKLRNRFVRLANRLNSEIRWIEVRAKEEIIRERVTKKRRYSEADFEVYKKIKALYEPLEQAHLVLWSDELSIEEMTRRAKDFLMLTA